MNETGLVIALTILLAYIKYFNPLPIVQNVLFVIIFGTLFYAIISKIDFKSPNGNVDKQGKAYPWSNTIVGLVAIIAAIPLVIFFTLYLYGYITI